MPCECDDEGVEGSDEGDNNDSDGCDDEDDDSWHSLASCFRRGIFCG